MCFRLDSAGSGLWALLRPNQPASSQPLCPLFSVFDFQGQCAPADSRRLGSRQGLLGIAEKKSNMQPRNQAHAQAALRHACVQTWIHRQHCAYWSWPIGRHLGGVRRCVFFGAGSAWAPQVRLPPKFHSCERDFNALSGWGAGSRVPRLREPFVYYLVARRVVLRCFFVKSAMLCHIFVGPASPTPTPMCPSRDFGRKYFGGGPGAQNPRFQGAAERGGGQF
jgi:hypothetical protein